MEPIILASSSQRRQEIFKQLGIPFRVMIPEIDETAPSDMNIHDIAEFLATKKVNSVLHALPPNQAVSWIFGADTLVIKDNKVYGKPQDTDEAASFLQAFSGSKHEVISAIALFNGKLNYLSTRVSKTFVEFAELSEKEIEWYLNTYEWHGVAGAYRIQGLASCFIKKIEGSYSSVVGLPIFEFYDILKEQGYSIFE
ncbi:MAG: Maf family protein [Treponemataceae bacterium]